ncbi:MAG TPA: hypothetical protein VLJ80_06665 [Solirubrobacteraceae bacterium]|nr:hypothetical protein [Solirubrobacteraceae bacterium]
MSTSVTGRGIAVLAAATISLFGALATASQAGAATYYACVKKNGSAHIYSSKPKCKRGESKLSWNNVGPAGKNGSGANGANGANGKEGPKGETGAKGEPGLPATTLWSVVDKTGAQVRGGTGAVSTKSLTGGEYEVVFNRNVTKCAYVATLGDPGEGNPPIGMIGVATREGNPNGVFIETFNTAGTLTNEAFQLAVFC